MNRTFWIIIAVLVVIGGGFLFLRPAANLSGGVSNQATTSSSLATSTQPTVTIGTPSVKTITVMTSFTTDSFISTSTYPTIGGTANVPQVGIIVNNSKDVGVVGTSEIPVVNGRWSYSCSVALPPGSYSLVLFVGNRVTSTAKLTVR